MKILSLFDGMACGHIAFNELGINIESYKAYEIDKYAIKVATHNFSDIEECGDVFAGNFKEYEGYDWLIGGSPCTYWSIAQSPDRRETIASGIGWELFSQYVRALKEAKPKYFLYENNKSMSKEIRKAITDAFGFEPIHIDSSLVSAQSRHRLYWVGIRQEDGTYKKANVKLPEDKGIVVKDILDESINEVLCTNSKGKSRTLLSSYYKDGQFDLIKGGNYSRTAICHKVFELPNDKDGRQTNSQATRVYDINYKSCAQSSQGGGRCAQTGLYAVPDSAEGALLVKDGYVNYKGKQYPIKLSDGYYVIRKLSVSECKRLQTVPDWYDMTCVSKSQAYKCLGNGWTVKVIEHLIKSAMEKI